MITIFKGKGWTARFTSELGAICINTSGAVPAVVNKSAAELVKKNVPYNYAKKVFKAQFKDLIITETEA